SGPKMRVPRGFKSLSIITIALLSKRNREPSSRRIGCFVRTRTARTTSPFFTVPVALASFTFAVITSPIPAKRVDLPITLIMVAMRAPLLSATSSLDRSCTIRPTIYSQVILKLLLDNLYQAPALQPTQWPRLHDPNPVAGFRFVLFVVRVNVSHLFNNFAELGMRHACDRPHDNRLVHAARNHLASARFARTAGEARGLQGRWRRRLLLLSHKFTFSGFVPRAAIALSQSGQHRVAANATCSAARAGRSAVANADAGSPAASRVSWLATRPCSSR